MFQSFFPKPKLFFISFAVWAALSMFVWYEYGAGLAPLFGLKIVADAEPVIGAGHFITPDLIWFYIFFTFSTAIFSAFWYWFSEQKWFMWSVLGSSLILFMTYLGVQASVALNNWRGPFFDMIQKALTPEYKGPKITTSQLYQGLVDFLAIALFAVFISVILRFVTSHYVFRWRTAMTDYYMARWSKLREIEGASQRVQEDTMRFAGLAENIGINILDSILTLIAFIPVLAALSIHITELPFIGQVASPLLVMAIGWSIFGTILMLVVGIKLPGLEFKNQRVEAAYRKELVYGEDDIGRAEPMSISELFLNIRKNYFTLYFHYLYFNVARIFYLQIDNIFALFLLVPTIIVGKITFGIFQQILSAFGQVANSFQYLVNSWPNIIELISIYKRLAAFEATLDNAPLPKIDQEWIERPQEV
jgi:peptide/bleomycin uptake transporter